MALKQIGFVDLISAIKQRVEADTDYTCYDAVPKNAPSPFYFAEAINKRPDNTKTCFRDVFTVNIHCIAQAEDNGSSVGVYEMIQALEEALTVDIDLGTEYWLISQTDTGVQTIFEEETKEKHAVCGFEFRVSYGFKTKIQKGK